MDFHDTDEKRFIRAVLAGDRDSFAPLVRAHQGKVLSLCLSLLRDRASAEDAAQDAFIKAYKGLRGFRLEASFSTWLYRIAHRACLDSMRSRSRRRTEPLDALGDGPAAPPAEDPSAVESLLSSLPVEYRLILTLREAQGFSYEEISRVMESSLDSVKARLRRARAALQQSARHLLGPAGVQTSGGGR